MSGRAMTAAVLVVAAACGRSASPGAAGAQPDAGGERAGDESVVPVARAPETSPPLLACPEPGAAAPCRLEPLASDGPRFSRGHPIAGHVAPGRLAVLGTTYRCGYIGLCYTETWLSRLGTDSEHDTRTPLDLSATSAVWANGGFYVAAYAEDGPGLLAHVPDDGEVTTLAALDSACGRLLWDGRRLACTDRDIERVQWLTPDGSALGPPARLSAEITAVDAIALGGELRVLERLREDAFRLLRVDPEGSVQPAGELVTAGRARMARVDRSGERLAVAYAHDVGAEQLGTDEDPRWARRLEVQLRWLNFDGAPLGSPVAVGTARIPSGVDTVAIRDVSGGPRDALVAYASYGVREVETAGGRRRLRWQTEYNVRAVTHDGDLGPVTTLRGPSSFDYVPLRVFRKGCWTAIATVTPSWLGRCR